MLEKLVLKILLLLDIRLVSGGHRNLSRQLLGLLHVLLVVVIWRL